MDKIVDPKSFCDPPVEEDDGLWEEVVDFTEIKKDGVGIKEILDRL